MSGIRVFTFADWRSAWCDPRQHCRTGRTDRTLRDSA